MSGVGVRLRYAKAGKVRWTSHRDAARIWERALRRAGVAVAYTEGFSPRPRLHFGLALPTGYESEAELLDVDLAASAEDLDVDLLPGRLSAALPVGFEVTAAAALTGAEPSLQQDVTCCSWRIELRGVTTGQAEAAVANALAAPTLALARTRKGHASVDDIRPAHPRPERRWHHARRSGRGAGRSGHPPPCSASERAAGGVLP